MDPAVEWRRRRRLPQPTAEPWPSRVGAFISACAREAASFEVAIEEVALGWARAQSGGGPKDSAEAARQRWESKQG
jgi:predicted nucleic acid-binding Zn ribbon protein